MRWTSDFLPDPKRLIRRSLWDSEATDHSCTCQGAVTIEYLASLILSYYHWKHEPVTCYYLEFKNNFLNDKIRLHKGEACIFQEDRTPIRCSILDSVFAGNSSQLRKHGFASFHNLTIIVLSLRTSCFDVHIASLHKWSWLNVPQFTDAPIFQYTHGAYTNGIPICVRPRGYTVHRLAYTVQPRGQTGMGRGKYLHMHEVGNGILRKPECYTGVPCRNTPSIH